MWNAGRWVEDMQFLGIDGCFTQDVEMVDHDTDDVIALCKFAAHVPGDGTHGDRRILFRMSIRKARNSLWFPACNFTLKCLTLDNTSSNKRSGIYKAVKLRH